VIGTAAYMAPEQAEGREARAPADLYSLAVVLYEALTGVNPVRTGTAAQRARRLGAYLPPLRRQRRDLPRELGQGIDLALRPRPRERGSLEELREALCTAAERVDDRPGVVTSAWSAQADDERPDTGGPSRSDRVEQARAATWPARAAAAAAAAALAAWVDAHLLSPAPIAASAAALTAGLLIAALPRIGWAVLAATISGSLALQSRPGAALLVLIASLVPVMLLPHRPASWPLSAAATALGLLGLAGMWPALAALASTVWRRTALGIAGWLWLVLMTPLADADLYIRPSHTPAAVWTLSLYGTTHQLLGQIVTAEMLAPAIVWGLAAATLPRITRGPLPIDIVLIAVWAATVASVTATVVGRGQITGRHALLGAVAGALVALVPAVVRAWTRARDSANAGAGLA
jgi:serine/threonine-protein kinase